MEGGGDGAYAKKDIPAGTLVAYYNGIRLKAGENSPYYDTGYAIFVEWNRKSLFGYKNGEHMDLPTKVMSAGTCHHGLLLTCSYFSTRAMQAIRPHLHTS